MAAFGLGSLPTLAAAAPPSDAWCPLSRSPFVAYHGLPTALQCAFDQDGNGLDDAIEKELARCVAPQIRFDPEERWHRRGGSAYFEPCPENNSSFSGDPSCPAQTPFDPSCCGSTGWWAQHGGIFIGPNDVAEPNATFTVTRLTSDIVQVSYKVLWRWDGGFLLDSDTGCDDHHLGDTQPLEVLVRVLSSPYGWRATPIQMRGCLAAFPGIYAAIWVVVDTALRS
jgi:hypothetical protein